MSTCVIAKEEVRVEKNLDKRRKQADQGFISVMQNYVVNYLLNFESDASILSLNTIVSL